MYTEVTGLCPYLICQLFQWPIYRYNWNFLRNNAVIVCVLCIRIMLSLTMDINCFTQQWKHFSMAFWIKDHWIIRKQFENHYETIYIFPFISTAPNLLKKSNSRNNIPLRIFHPFLESEICEGLSYMFGFLLLRLLNSKLDIEFNRLHIKCFTC